MAVDVYISEEQIQNRIDQLAAKINEDYKDADEIIVAGVLNGSFMFCADLVRRINVPVVVDFMKASSYGEGTVSSGNVKVELDLREDVSGKHVLLVEDIVDTGLTIKNLMHFMGNRDTKSVKLASLLYKPSRLEHSVDIDYLGFEIEDKFVIGYGLDYAGKYRELPFIGVYSGD